MIRKALQDLAGQDTPGWLHRHIPDAVWRWAFEVTPTEALLQSAYCELRARPGITVYDFEDGHEVNRRTYDPIGALREAVAAMIPVFDEIGKRLTAAFSNLAGWGSTLRDIRKL